MKRSEAREQAFILIFERSFKEESMDEIIEQAVIGRHLEVNDYAYELAKDVCGHLPWLDETITKYSKKWKLNRMSRVALSILRMSLWEIGNFEHVPVGASINEAVELAKKYGSEDDFSFVNGVLGAYARDQEKGPLESVLQDETESASPDETEGVSRTEIESAGQEESANAPQAVLQEKQLAGPGE